MCMYGGHMCISVPNMKFLRLTQCHGEVCTDDDADDNANDARQRTMGNS